MSTTLSRHVVALACLATCQLALAQTQSTEPIQLQRVQVTGSNIKRIDQEGSTPLQVISRQDIQATGAKTLAQVIEALPNGGTLNDLGRGNSFAPGASSANLRDMGQQSTLLLLNGRRIAPFALADYNEIFSNLDAIPASAIDRVEILKSGGSAVYGSDAVAGVINVITRRDYEGLEMAASRTQASKTAKFGENAVSLSGGLGNLDTQGFNVLAGVELYEREAVPAWRPLLGDTNPVYAKVSKRIGAKSTYSFPGNIFGTASDYAAPVAGCKPELIEGSLCRYDRFSNYGPVAGSKRANVFVAGTLNLGGGTEAFAELTWAGTKTAYSSPHSIYDSYDTTSVWGNPTTGDRKTFQYRLLPAGHPLGLPDEDTELRYRFADAPSGMSTKASQYRALTGVRGTWQNWDWESAVGVMGAQATSTWQGTFSEKGFIELIGDPNKEVLDANFFNKPGGYKIGGPNSAAVINKLFAPTQDVGRNRQIFWDGRISGEFGHLPGGAIGVAAGFELRHERFTVSPSANQMEGDAVGLGVSSADGQRTFGAVFTEAKLPLAKWLTGEVAVRMDRFPGFGSNWAPKVGLVFQPVKSVALRTTLENGFRAPNLTETAKSTKFAFSSVDDKKRCQPARQLAEDLRTQAATLPDGDTQQALLYARADAVENAECGSVGVSTTHNPALKPEKSRIATLGLLFEPNAHVSASVDYYRIVRRDEIGTPDNDKLLEREGNLPPGVSIDRTAFNPAVGDTTFRGTEAQQYGVQVGRLLRINSPFTNEARTRAAGLDWRLVLSSDETGAGRFKFTTDISHLLQRQYWDYNANTWDENGVGYYDYPRTATKMSLTQTRGAWTHTLTYNRLSGTPLTTKASDTDWNEDYCADNGVSAELCKIAVKQRFDYYVAYSGIRGLTVSLAVRNVLNDYAPVNMRSFGGDTGVLPTNKDDVKGRVFTLGLQYRFK
ncbi:TonB-dependent receptor plug domain-containing protein [Roseateles sp. BYS180W]|uniref:TonB-dependent receptor plug domain-containing protein n=1 Tax=Roseateles rivi TaxID=3299028 RepID=A0ABW7FUG1_9BURK